MRNKELRTTGWGTYKRYVGRSSQTGSFEIETEGRWSVDKMEGGMSTGVGIRGEVCSKTTGIEARISKGEDQILELPDEERKYDFKR